jgi:hypothetical protein
MMCFPKVVSRTAGKPSRGGRGFGRGEHQCIVQSHYQRAPRPVFARIGVRDDNKKKEAMTDK